MRKLEFDFSAIAFSDVAVRLEKVAVASKVELSGFLAPRSMKTTKLVVHITEFKI
jgi:primosomal replication protein N